MKKILWSVLLVSLLFAVTGSNAQNSDTSKLKYVFLFIGDGMGLNQVFLAEKYFAETKEDTLIFLDPDWKFGLVRTECSDENKITDSGAAGTAIACGIKTHYGSIGMDTAAKPIQSIAEFLHEKKFRIGIISSVALNHATPASFYGHQTTRRNYDQLTSQLIKSKFDFFAGGGIQLGSSDTAKKIFSGFNEVLDSLRKGGFNLVLNTADIGKEKKILPLPVVVIDTAIRNVQQKTKGLYEDGQNALPYAIDHPEYINKIAEYTEAAIHCFEEDTNGFFIMVEGGQIDWACHDNDAATAVKEVQAFNAAIKEAVAFYEAHPKQTLVIVTADHETGGMTMGRGYGESSKTGNSYAMHAGKLSSQNKSLLYSDSATVAKINYEAQVGWTSDEHTGLPVGIWTLGSGSKVFSDIIENSEIKKKTINLVRRKVNSKTDSKTNTVKDQKSVR